MKDILVNAIMNFPLVAATSSMAAAQTIKVICYFFKEKKINLYHLLEAGGMPSGHSSTVCGLTLSVGLSSGISSPLFAASLVFSLIVMYDAAGVRRAASEQALVLNKIAKQLNFSNEVGSYGNLKEILGHTPFEVLIGAIVGILTTTLLYFLFYI